MYKLTLTITLEGDDVVSLKNQANDILKHTSKDAHADMLIEENEEYFDHDEGFLADLLMEQREQM